MTTPITIYALHGNPHPFQRGRWKSEDGPGIAARGFRRQLATVGQKLDYIEPTKQLTNPF